MIDIWVAQYLALLFSFVSLNKLGNLSKCTGNFATLPRISNLWGKFLGDRCSRCLALSTRGMFLCRALAVVVSLVRFSLTTGIMIFISRSFCSLFTTHSIYHRQITTNQVRAFLGVSLVSTLLDLKQSQNYFLNK